MKSKTLLIKVLKQFLKEKNKTYKDIAKLLDLSEGSVKRLFSKCDLSTERLFIILDYLDKDISDLAKHMQLNAQVITQISLRDEQVLVDDLPTLFIALLVLNNWKFEEILAYHHLSESEVEKALLKLDKMGIIELLPLNRYRLKVSNNFQWQPQGPIQQFFIDHLSHKFLTDTDKNNDEFKFLMGMVNEESYQQLKDKVDALCHDFYEINHENKSLKLTDKKTTFMVVSLRQNWTSTVFSKYHKN